VSIRELLEGLGQAVDAHLGETATWTPAGGAPALTDVPVEIDERDEAAPAFGGRDGAILRSVIVQVRAVHVPTPGRDDVVALAAGDRFLITADPLIDRDGFWTCPARRLAP
jgi:hypothetical protein